MSTEPRLTEPTVVDIGVPGLVLSHHPSTCIKGSGLPVDGEWSVLWGDTRIHRAGFRTLHAAAHYAFRVHDLPGAVVEIAAACRTKQKTTDALSKALRHAEGHAHECDAAYPAGTVIPFSHGPSIVDDDGLTRAYISQAPSIKWEKADDGHLCCPECGDPASHIWDVD